MATQRKFLSSELVEEKKRAQSYKTFYGRNLRMLVIS